VRGLYQPLATEINSTFASHHTAQLPFEQALSAKYIAKYNAKKTGKKHLINPTL